MGVKRACILLAVLLAAGSLATAVRASDTTKIGNLVIEHAWSRPTDAMAQTGAIYLVVKNTGATADSLISALSDVAGKVELHSTVNEGGMMRMKPVSSIKVPGNGSAKLSPGGYHVMLIDLKSQLTEGQTYTVKLTFEKAGEVSVPVHVEKGMGGGSMSHSGMSGSDDHMKGSNMEGMKH